ncbi:MAG: AarF/UbiB family protein [Anaerolineales bacterium]|nr:AarF/UbiB family protein [Anaerolineales bacterium]
MIRARYRRIILFFARMLISLAVWELILPRIGFRRAARRTRPQRLRRSAKAYRTLAVQMGGVLIKVGQFLSSRVDILPPEFTDELKGLQDEVPPAPFDEIRRLAEIEYGAPLEQVFTRFEKQPLAAASLGQVHRAYLPDALTDQTADRSSVDLDRRSLDGYNVVVKILRPNIEQLIETDLAALRTVGAWLHRYQPIRRRANVPALLEEFTRVLYEEIDYLAEGRNAETFAANFKNYPGVRVPRVIWTRTTRRALTLENVLAIKITDYETITSAGICRSEVASRLLNTYLKQIFEDGFFHADPHPGNLFVRPLSPHPTEENEKGVAWELTFVDFGMVGRVPDNLREGLRELLIGVGTRDAHRVVQAYQKMDLLLPNADLALIERAGARVFERYWGKNMTELTSVSYQEMKDLAEEFRELIYQLPFQVPQNIIFLGRCVGILSGMCTGLDPQFNLWDHLAPFARKLITEEARAGWETWLAEAEKLARTFLLLPLKIDATLNKIERGEVSVQMPEVSQQVQRLERTLSNVTISVIFSAFLLSGVDLLLAGKELMGGVLLGAAGVSLLSLIIRSRNRS